MTHKTALAAALLAAVCVLSACGTMETREQRLWHQGAEKLDLLSARGCEEEVTPLFLKMNDADSNSELAIANDRIDAALAECSG